MLPQKSIGFRRLRTFPVLSLERSPRYLGAMKRCSGLLAYCFLVSSAVHGQDEEPWTFNFFLENDLFANTDLNYTNGVRFSSISPDLDSFEDPNGQKYPWVEKLNGILAFVHPDPTSPDTDPVNQNMVISFGQLMFTPTDKFRTTLDPDDRPYAGYLYLGLGYHARTGATLHSTEFNFGVVGPGALARQAQNLVHDIGGWERFAGWDNQLKNEPAFQLVFERKHKNGKINLGVLDDIEAELITHWGGSIGTVASYVNLGTEFRLGWDLPDDFGTSTLRPGGDNNTPGLTRSDDSRIRLHGFIAVDGRLMANNIFLDGNYFRSSHSVQRRETVADIAAGIAGSWEKLRFSYAHIYRTKEFYGQQEGQFYGAFSLSYLYQF